MCHRPRYRALRGRPQARRLSRSLRRGSAFLIRVNRCHRELRRRADDPDANDPAAVPRKQRHKLPPVPRQSPSEREQEDVQVAGFYFNDGNFRGSYDRAKDAVTLDNDDPEAQLALGNAARKLGKLDEAEKAYKRCLDLDPVPKVRKAADRGGSELTGG